MPIEDVNAWLMLLALVAYVLLGGADFGAGVLDMLALGPRRERHREALSHAIGPIWEANHVWLILVIVVLFTCFPPAFAAIMTALHVPLTLVLLGIIARGTSFVFRTYTGGGDAAQARWGKVFSMASVITPVMLGVSLGALASGDLRWEGGTYLGGFFGPWLRPFPAAVGALTLAIFTFLAATYMCAESTDNALKSDFRARALWSGLAVALTAGLAWLISGAGAPLFSHRLTQHWWAIPLLLGTGLTATGAIAALWSRRYVLARTLAAVQVTCIVLGFGGALFPHLVVPDFTIEGSAAPGSTQLFVLVTLCIGAVLLAPSLYLLFRVFKGRRAFMLLDDR